MNNIDCIKSQNFEDLGKNFFEKAVAFTLAHEFSKAFEYLKEGLSFLTCDCQRGKWYEKFEQTDIEIFNDIEHSDVNHAEYFFVKAYLLSHSENTMKLYSALDAVNKYITNNSKDSDGYYVKGKILNELELFEEGFNCYLQASEISENKRLQYRIGRIKELKLGEFGIDLLYSSFIENPSSICCAENLHTAFHHKELELVIDPKHSANPLLQSFIINKDMIFFITYLKTFSRQLDNPDLKVELNEFLETLARNATLFDNQTEDEDEDEDDDDDENDYNSSYSYESSSNPMDSEFYNDSLDMDQQSPEFWDDI